MPNLHFLLLFEGAYIDSQLLDTMPEAALINAKDFGRLDLNTARSAQRFYDQPPFNFLEALIEAGRTQPPPAAHPKGAPDGGAVG